MQLNSLTTNTQYLTTMTYHYDSALDLAITELNLHDDAQAFYKELTNRQQLEELAAILSGELN